MSSINDERREYMAGLIELMTERCADHGLSYMEEMATMVMVWLGACDVYANTGSTGPTPSLMVEAIVPGTAAIPEGVARSPRSRGVAADEDPRDRKRRTDGSFEKGRAAAAGGASRESCPYKSTNGGYQAAWLTGFDEAVGEAVERGTESGIGVGPGASTPGPVGRGVKRESDAPQTEGIVDRNDTTQ